jgi:isochorismate synthase
VRAGELTKAVIARPIVVRSSEPIDVHAVLRRLRASFGSSYRYSIDGFIGASPELLVEVDGAVVRSHPLAGTAPRTGDVDNDARIAAELIASTKDQVEHRVVIDVVHDTLLPWASYLDWEPEPSIVTVANVQHLGTRMEGMLSQPGPSVIELVRALSPTPALGGHPRDAAIELIQRVEGFERGRYGGAVGWVDAAGNGTWAVAIRCAELSDDRRSARLVAGGGIVADSDPHAELAETQAKFQAMLSAIVRPARWRARRRRRATACRTAARTALRAAGGLRQEREDPAAVVVDHDDAQVDIPRSARPTSALLSWTNARSPSSTKVGATGERPAERRRAPRRCRWRPGSRALGRCDHRTTRGRAPASTTRRSARHRRQVVGDDPRHVRFGQLVERPQVVDDRLLAAGPPAHASPHPPARPDPTPTGGARRGA